MILRCLILLIGLRAASFADAALFDYAAFLKEVRVPPEFSIELAAGAPGIRFPMFACFDDAGRLYVAESSGNDLYAGLQKLTRDCRVSRLEDTNGDGVFDKGVVFQEGVTFPMGLAWHEGRLYLADPPELVALMDTDGDGRADKREVILSGFGHTDNGSLHGLTFGPDGLLYFTMGAPDGWKLPRGDGTFLEGVAGALFRCRPDGSRPEVISRGFENLVEIEIMPGGEFIGTDNWYQVPAGGYRDALVDCAPGGLYPYAADRGTPLPRTGVTLPPLTMMPAVALSGLVRPRGLGLPEAWRESLFSAQHNTRKVVRHELHRAGSTFASTNVDFIVGAPPDFHPSDVLEDADGSLLIVDTGGWYVEHCPTGRIRDSRAPGGIYRVRWNGAVKVTDPRGLGLNWEGASRVELLKRLRDSRFVVADRASEELVRRGEVDVLIAATRTGRDGVAEHESVRLRALWSLGRLAGGGALGRLRELLSDANPAIVTASARALALREDKTAGDILVTLLDSAHAPVRRAASEALAVCGSNAHGPRLVAALAEVGDVFEEHATIAALLALATEPFIRGLLEHEAPRVRRAALHLLDQPPFATLRFIDLVRPLGDADNLLRMGARSLLERHRDWAGEAAPWLREQLAGAPAGSAHSVALAGLIATFQTNAAVRGLISEWLDPSSSLSDPARAFALGLLPSLTTQKPEAAWLRAIPSALTNPNLRVSALGAAAAFPQTDWGPILADVAEDGTVPIAQRFLAARLVSPQPLLSESVFALALDSLDSKSGATERLAAVDLLSRVQLRPSQVRRLLGVLQKRGPVAPDALLPALTRAATAETRPALGEFFANRLNNGWSPSRATFEHALNVFAEAAPERAALLASWERNNATMLERLQSFAPLLNGGDAELGREWFSVATCFGCHRIGGHGGLIGPDLTKIGAIRSGNDLIESILFPSSSFAQGYEPYRLRRRDGVELEGVLVARELEVVSLRDATGAMLYVSDAEVASLDRLELSTMPAGLEQQLSREQLRDLLAYLQSLK
jgi:putative membrane-bound dehydrogenase-like protein